MRLRCSRSTPNAGFTRSRFRSVAVSLGRGFARSRFRSVAVSLDRGWIVVVKCADRGRPGAEEYITLYLCLTSQLLFQYCAAWTVITWFSLISHDIVFASLLLTLWGVRICAVFVFNKSARILTCSYVFVHKDTVRVSLQPPYQGSFQVITRKDILNFNGKSETVSLDRLKTVYMGKKRVWNNSSFRCGRKKKFQLRRLLLFL